MYYWVCIAEDNTRGCFNADYDGRCRAIGRKGFKTKEAALKAGEKHRCWLANKYMYGRSSISIIEARKHPRKYK